MLLPKQYCKETWKWVVACHTVRQKSKYETLLSTARHMLYTLMQNTAKGQSTTFLFKDIYTIYQDLRFTINNLVPAKIYKL